MTLCEFQALYDELTKPNVLHFKIMTYATNSALRQIMQEIFLVSCAAA